MNKPDVNLNRRVFSTGLVSACAAPAWAQNEKTYPSRVINMVVPGPAGGPTDMMARAISSALGARLGQAVVIENLSGAGGTIGIASVARAKPDGHTLVLTLSTPLVVLPNTRKDMPFNVRRDLVPVSQLGESQMGMYVNPSLGVSTLKEFIALAKSKPGELAYATSGVGSAPHIGMEVLSRQTGIKLNPIPYKGAAPALQDLLGGQISMAFSDIGSWMPQVTAGKVKAIAVGGAQRTPFLPNVPTFAEQGVANMEAFVFWWGLLAPAGTPAPIVERLSADLQKIVSAPEMRARFAALVAVPTGTTPARTAEILNDQLSRWAKFVSSMPDISFVD